MLIRFSILSFFMKMASIKQWAVMKFWMKCSFFITVSLDILKKVYSDECLSCCIVFEWYKLFLRVKLQSKMMRGPDVQASQKWTKMWMLSGNCCSNYGKWPAMVLQRNDTWQKVLNSIFLLVWQGKVGSHFVPHLLGKEEKDHRMLYLQEIINMTDSDYDFLNSIVAGDKSLFFE